jgi:hypothetical protein
MHKKVLQELSRALLSGAVKAQSKIVLDSFGNELVFRNPRDQEFEKFASSMN